MLFKSQMKVGVLEQNKFEFCDIFPFVHFCDPSLRTWSHGQRMQGEEQ